MPMKIVLKFELLYTIYMIYTVDNNISLIFKAFSFAEVASLLP